MKWRQFGWDKWIEASRAAGTARIETQYLHHYLKNSHLIKNKTNVSSQLPGHAQPMPSAYDFVAGIPHKNRDKLEQNPADKLWAPVKAIASWKMHGLPVLGKHLDGKHDSAAGEWYFDKVFPDTVSRMSDWNGDVLPLPNTCKQKLIRGGLFKNDYELTRNILTLHDGEARIVIDRGFEPFPADVDIRNARFWHYQFAKKNRVREWLYTRSDVQRKPGPLTDGEIKWILDQEENETLLLRWTPPPWPRSNQASGWQPRLEEGTWEIRAGNYITLTELFTFGARDVTCFDLYKMYLGMDYYIFRRKHSTSTTENGSKRQNAKTLRWSDCRRRGLPAEGTPWHVHNWWDW